MNQIEIHEIKNINDPYFDEFWKVYSERSEERRVRERVCVPV